MYIIKNALRCISRSKGRNVLLGIIALVIAVSACIGLSIRQAAESAKNDTLEGMSVTATISYDRREMMNKMEKPSESGFDKDSFTQMLENTQSLTLEDYEVYAGAESVEDFYYTLTASFDGSEELEPVSTETESENSFSDFGGKRGGMTGGIMGGMTSGDFSVIGYSSDIAMTDFTSGTASISDGAVFDEGTEELNCIISQELATFNSISVGDSITVTSTNAEEETYTLTVVGIYQSSETNSSFAMPGMSTDPANEIYMSAAALQKIIDASESVSQTVTDEDTDRQYETKTVGTLSATYVFEDTDSYYQFEEQARSLGLAEDFSISSTDITAFENSLTPLKTLSKMAGWFLVVILIIGAVILVVLGIFNIRERKYEIGVLTAMGMSKGKVALQFMTEILAVTMIAVLLGAVIGAVSSVPVTNVLLEQQVQSSQNRQSDMDAGFGRPGNMGSMSKDFQQESQLTVPDDAVSGGFDKLMQSTENYITEIDSAMNLTVVLQMLLIGLALSLISGAVSVLFVMRYDPLKILANRD